jgi:hypothetical protein
MLPNPVIELPGLTPISPTSVVGPVFVTAEPPRTAKSWAVPNVPFPCGQPPEVGVAVGVVVGVADDVGVTVGEAVCVAIAVAVPVAVADKVGVSVGTPV